MTDQSVIFVESHVFCNRLILALPKTRFEKYSQLQQILNKLTAMHLAELPLGVRASVVTVTPFSSPDPIADRLRDLGFVAGEPVQLVAHGPFGADPLLVQIGFTRFALRRREAERVEVRHD